MVSISHVFTYLDRFLKFYKIRNNSFVFFFNFIDVQKPFFSTVVIILLCIIDFGPFRPLQQFTRRAKTDNRNKFIIPIFDVKI